LTEKNPLSLCPIRSKSKHDVGILPMSTISLVLSVQNFIFKFSAPNKNEILNVSPFNFVFNSATSDFTLINSVLVVFKFEIEVSIRIVIADSLVKNETNTDNYKKRF